MLPRPKEIMKELFTYDPDLIKAKHISMYTRAEEEYVSDAFVSLRKFDSEIFAKKFK